MLTSRRGATLLEALLAIVLGLLATALGYRFFCSFWRISRDVTARAEMQQMAAAAMGRIAVDARRSAVPGVSLSPGRLGLVGLADLDSSGRQLWDQKVTLYYGRGSRLVRREAPVGTGLEMFPHLPTRLTPEQMEALANPGGGTCLCDCLASLQAALYGPDGTPPLSITLTLARTLVSGKQSSLTFSRDFCLRNAP